MISHGRRGTHKRYLCKNCGSSFTGKRHISKEQIWDLYQSGLSQAKIAEALGVSPSTIKRRLQEVSVDFKTPILSEGVIHIDATYWGRNQGLIVALDDKSGCVLYREWISHESKVDYATALKKIEEGGYKILAVVTDGGVGLDMALKHFPTQMCQYHFIAIVRRKLTLRPKLPASQELLALAMSVGKMSHITFCSQLKKWETKWDTFLKEKTINDENGKWQYTHKSLRSAHFSFRQYLPTLFTYEEHPDIQIPKTNNAIEGLFTALKSRLRAHNGMSQAHKKRFVDVFLGIGISPSLHPKKRRGNSTPPLSV